MKKFENINSLQLIDMFVMQAAIESSMTSQEVGIPAQLHFNIGVRHGLNIEENKAIVKVAVGIEVLHSDSTPVNLTAKFEIDFLFNVLELDQYVKREEGKGIIDVSLLGSLLSTAYSTARGVIYTRCLGTVLGNVVIPIISVQQLIQLAEKNNSTPHQTNS